MALGEKLRGALDKIQQASAIDKETVKDALKEMQRALISADVEIKLVLELSKKIEGKAFKELPKGLTRREHIVKLMHDSLSELIGGKNETQEKEPKKILLVGLYGMGKTTTAVKLAKYYSKRGRKVGLIGADTYRPAALEQLKQLAEKEKIAVYGNKKEKEPYKVVEQGLRELKDYDLLIVDSAGRNALEGNLVEEIEKVEKTLKADQRWLVMGADIGQIAKKQAEAFHNAVKVNGVIITRIDGSAKGGGALAGCAVTKAQVLFIGTGEKAGDLEEFDAQRYLGRIMGYGDLAGLLEKAKEAAENEEISPEEMLKGEFTLKAFYQQLKAARKMGPLDKVAEMMGLKMQLPKEALEQSEEKLDKFKVMMDSMTEQELREPEKLNKNRIQRVSKGSGTTEEEVRELIKQYKQMKKMFKNFKKIGSKKKIEKMQKKGGLDLAGLMGGKVKKKKFKIR